MIGYEELAKKYWERKSQLLLETCTRTTQSTANSKRLVWDWSQTYTMIAWRRTNLLR